MRTILPALMLVAGGCDQALGPESAVDRGEAVFASSALSQSDINVFSCATCHTMDASGGPQAVAVSLHRTTDRSAWWGGNVQTLYEAADFCFVYFMRGFPELDREATDARALFAYLAATGTGEPLPPRPVTVVENIADVGPGEAALGEAVYQRSCKRCHGAPHTGRGRIGPRASIVPETSLDFADAGGFDPRLVIVEKVRHGQFFGVGGNMPFFSLEALGDDDLADLLAYLLPETSP